MSRIFILYGTTDGHTGKIAGVLATALEGLGCRADVLNAKRAGAVRLEDYSGVIIAASLHARGYQRSVTRWVRGHAAELSKLPGAFVSVCLGILEPSVEVRHDLAVILNRFQDQLGWRPDEIRIVAGALPYTRYGWLKKWVMKRIAAKTGGGTDTARDYEYTDWNDVRLFATQFATTHALVPAPPPAPDAAAVAALAAAP